MATRRDLVLPPEQQDLKAASKALIRAYGGQEAAEAILGRRQQHYSDCGLPNTPDFLTIDEASRLEDRTHGQPGHPHVTREMARRQGCALMPLPEALPAGADLMPHLKRLMKEFGDASAAACGAVADGTVSRAEARKSGREFDELIEVAVTIRAAFAAIEGDS